MTEPERHEVTLPNGRLSVAVTVQSADWPLARLCAFAARHNPRRGFLFVSKVLAKHHPSTPADISTAVWTAATRTLTVAAGLTPAQELKIDQTKQLVEQVQTKVDATF